MKLRIGLPISTEVVREHDEAVAQQAAKPTFTEYARPTSDNSPSRSLRSCLIDKFSGRQTAFTTVIPGTGRSINRALRSDLPGATSSHDPQDKDHDELLAYAHELNAMAHAMLQSKENSLSNHWERPAPSTARRITTKVFPWLKPYSLRELARPNDKPPETPSFPSETSGRQAIADAAKELHDLVDLRRKNLDYATIALTNARVHLHTLQERAGTAHLTITTRRGQELVSNLQEQIAEARARVRTSHRATQSASKHLQEVLHSTDLLHLTALTEIQDQQNQRVVFSRQWLTDLKGHLQAVDTQLADRHTAIILEMELKTRQTRELIALDHDMIVAERAQLSAETYLQALCARLPGTAEGSSARAALNTVIDQVVSKRDKFRDEHHRLANNLAQVSADCAQLNNDIAKLYKKLGNETRRRRVEPRNPAVSAIDEYLQQSTSPVDEALPDKAAISAIQARYMTHQLETAQAFPAATGADLDVLKAMLQPMGERLSSKDPATMIPPFAVMEMITSTLAEVTGQDAKRAARILDALNQHPAAHWPVLAEGLSQSQRAGIRASTLIQDIVVTCRKLASLPCGIDLLRVLSNEGSTPAIQSESEALQVFWQADNAQQGNTSSEVEAWLQSAKAVARGTLEHIDTAFADVARGAFNAVRNGYFSNAPGSLYDQHDQRLKKATVEWVMRAAATHAPKDADQVLNSLAARRLLPNVNKTPFGKDVLSKAYNVSESMGMQSPRRMIDKLVTRRLDHLQTTIDTCRSLPGRHLDVAAAQAMVDHLNARQKRGDHLSQVMLQNKDIKAVCLNVTAKARERRLMSPQDSSALRKPTVLTKAQPVTLPALYEQLGTGELSVFEGLSRIEEQLRKGLQENQCQAVYTPNDEELAGTMRLLKNQHLSTKSDIVTFFKPFMLEGALRDRLRLGGGGTVGGGLPSLPYGVISPIASPVFSAEVSRSAEAFVQISLPSQGIEMTFGNVHSKAWEVSAGASTGASLAPMVGVQGSLTGRIANERTRTTSTTMRFYGDRNRDEETRNHMINALDSMTRWDVIDPDKGPRYKGPLEAIFARNPSISLSQTQSTTDIHTLGMRLSGRLPAMSFADGHGASQNLSLEAALFAEASRWRDVSNDTGGTVTTMGDKSSIAQQRLGLTTNFNMTPIASSSVPAGNGHHGILGQGLGLQAGVSRDMAWTFEKNEISPFLSNGKLGADLERQYSTPDELLAEIHANRGLWLQVALKKLEPDANGNKNTADNRLRAGILLSKFETRLKQLAKDNHYCLYSIVYEMKPRVGAAVDGYRGIQELARQRGDAAGVARAQQAIDDIMLMYGSWEPKYMIARERASDATSKGWRSLVRWQKLSTVNAQRTTALFPPP